MSAKLYVATETVLLNGEPDIIRGQTLVSGDSDLYKRFTHCFREATIHRGVEQATAAPGEVRQVELSPQEDPVEDDSAKKAARK